MLLFIVFNIVLFTSFFLFSEKGTEKYVSEIQIDEPVLPQSEPQEPVMHHGQVDVKQKNIVDELKEMLIVLEKDDDEKSSGGDNSTNQGPIKFQKLKHVEVNVRSQSLSDDLSSTYDKSNESNQQGEMKLPRLKHVDKAVRSQSLSDDLSSTSQNTNDNITKGSQQSSMKLPKLRHVDMKARSQSLSDELSSASQSLSNCSESSREPDQIKVQKLHHVDVKTRSKSLSNELFLNPQDQQQLATVKEKRSDKESKTEKARAIQRSLSLELLDSRIYDEDVILETKSINQNEEKSSMSQDSSAKDIEKMLSVPKNNPEGFSYKSNGAHKTTSVAKDDNSCQKAFVGNKIISDYKAFNKDPYLHLKETESENTPENIYCVPKDAQHRHVNGNVLEDTVKEGSKSPKDFQNGHLNLKGNIPKVHQSDNVSNGGYSVPNNNGGDFGHVKKGQSERINGEVYSVPKEKMPVKKIHPLKPHRSIENLDQIGTGPILKHFMKDTLESIYAKPMKQKVSFAPVSETTLIEKEENNNIGINSELHYDVPATDDRPALPKKERHNNNVDQVPTEATEIILRKRDRSASVPGSHNPQPLSTFSLRRASIDKQDHTPGERKISPNPPVRRSSLPTSPTKKEAPGGLMNRRKTEGDVQSHIKGNIHSGQPVIVIKSDGPDDSNSHDLMLIEREAKTGNSRIFRSFSPKKFPQLTHNDSIASDDESSNEVKHKQKQHSEMLNELRNNYCLSRKTDEMSSSHPSPPARSQSLKDNKKMTATPANQESKMEDGKVRERNTILDETDSLPRQTENMHLPRPSPPVRSNSLNEREISVSTDSENKTKESNKTQDKTSAVEPNKNNFHSLPRRTDKVSLIRPSPPVRSQSLKNLKRISRTDSAPELKTKVVGDSEYNIYRTQSCSSVVDYDVFSPPPNQDYRKKRYSSYDRDDYSNVMAKTQQNCDLGIEPASIASETQKISHTSQYSNSVHTNASVLASREQQPRRGSTPNLREEDDAAVLLRTKSCSSALDNSILVSKRRSAIFARQNLQSSSGGDQARSEDQAKQLRQELRAWMSLPDIPEMIPISQAKISRNRNGVRRTKKKQKYQLYPRLFRSQALYNCDADHDDELSFCAGEIIVIHGEKNSEWLYGEVEGQPERVGIFPLTFVEILDNLDGKKK